MRFFENSCEKSNKINHIFWGFSRNPWKSSKLLTSASNQNWRFFEVLLKWTSKILVTLILKNPQKNYKRQTSTSKNLKIWGWGWGSSNFEVTDANPTAAPTAWTQIKHTIFFAQIVTLIWNDLTVSKHSWQTEITSSGEENYLWIEPKEMDVNWISLKSEISSLKIDFINGIILWNQYLQ